jgi:hypothetical protein
MKNYGKIYIENYKDFTKQIGSFIKVSRYDWFDKVDSSDPKYGSRKHIIPIEDEIHCWFEFKNYRFRIARNAELKCVTFFLQDELCWGDELYDGRSKFNLEDAMELSLLLSNKFKCLVKTCAMEPNSFGNYYPKWTRALKGKPIEHGKRVVPPKEITFGDTLVYQTPEFLRSSAAIIESVRNDESIQGLSLAS